MTAATAPRPRRVARPLLIALLALVVALPFVGGRLASLANRARAASAPTLPAASLGTGAAAPTTWLPDDPDTGRPMEPVTRTQIATDFGRAWRQWHLSYLRGEPYGLRSYFVGPALDAVTASVEAARRDGSRIAQADTDHRVRLHFYSADGSIVAFTATSAVTRIVRDDGGHPLLAEETRDSYDVVMFLDDGNWRIRQWVRVGAEVLPFAAAAQPPADFIGVAGKELVLGGQPYRIAGLNYYPQAQPWHDFWPRYDGAVVERDFGTIAGLGLNTVRVFVPFDQFGGARPDPVMLDRLDDLLARAARQQLRVIVTLFDFHPAYDPILWPDDDRHIAGVAARFARNPAILAWDLKNEPDLDYRAGRDLIDLWLAHTLRTLRAHDPYHLVTIGWSAPTAAPTLAEGLDFVSFHYYGDPDSFAAAYGTLRAAAPARPIALTEFGLSTWNSPFFPGGHDEGEQAELYASIIGQARSGDGAGYLAWTLHDFSHVPGDVAGRAPWTTGAQSGFGVLRADGTAKPAARLLAPGAPLDVPATSPLARALKPFRIAALALLVTAVVLVCTLALPRLRRGGASRTIRR